MEEDLNAKPPWFVWSHPVLGPYHMAMCTIWFGCNIAYYGYNPPKAVSNFTLVCNIELIYSVGYDIENIKAAIESGTPLEPGKPQASVDKFDWSSIYMMQIQAALVEIPGYFVGMKAIDWMPLGRRGSVWVGLLIAGIFFLLGGLCRSVFLSI